MRIGLIALLAAIGCRGAESKESGIFDPRPQASDTDAASDTDLSSDTDTLSDTEEPPDTAVMEVDEDGDGFFGEDDCDDNNSFVNPDATEVCNGIDDDCDTLVDDEDPSVEETSTFYADADADGYGTDRYTTEACEAPSGYAADDGDCDDDDARFFPGASEDDCTDPADYNCDGSVGYADDDGDGFAACEDCDDSDASANSAGTEVCDDADNDCDGTTDEEASDAAAYYADSDGDGYGDADDVQTGCEAPSGYVDDDSDCDDDAADTYPGAEEICDELDSDCDDIVDEEAIDLATFYIDYDGDGYGSDAYTLEQCEAPTGYVDNADDCDDTEPLAAPDLTEVCDELDNDCDGDTDEDGASDASTWYADDDEDGFGDADDTTAACEQPSGYVDDDSDCDDDEPLDNPDANERYDEVDNDCDGTVDEDLWLGTGADGDLTVTSDTDLSTTASGSRTEADAVGYPVTALSGATITTDGDADGIDAGDEVLVINLHGSDSAHGSVGTYEFAWVDAVSADEITLVEDLTETFGERSNSDLSDQTIVVQRVPQYADVSISDGALLTTGLYDGSSGGLLALRATGTVFVEDGSAIIVDELGYAGGVTGTSSNCDSFQGESYAGDGDGDGDGACTAYNESYGLWAANYGGGGAHITGGGGNHAGNATAGDSWTGGSATAPEAGETYGDTGLSQLFFGSGGGGVWNDGTANPGPGGDGAGILFIAADTIELEGEAALSALGGTTTAWASGTWTYGAGGGAGGSVWLVAEEVDLAADSLVAEGGLGQSSYTRAGGDGGDGRIRIDCTTCNGFTQGTASALTALDDAASPDPGYCGTPE